MVRTKYVEDTHRMSTLGRKEVRINLKINPVLREEFQAAAYLRGASMSSLLHQHIVKIVREEKERSPEEFEKALEFVRRVGPDEEGGEELSAAEITALDREVGGRAAGKRPGRKGRNSGTRKR